MLRIFDFVRLVGRPGACWNQITACTLKHGCDRDHSESCGKNHIKKAGPEARSRNRPIPYAREDTAALAWLCDVRGEPDTLPGKLIGHNPADRTANSFRRGKFGVGFHAAFGDVDALVLVFRVDANADGPLERKPDKETQQEHPGEYGEQADRLDP